LLINCKYLVELIFDTTCKRQSVYWTDYDYLFKILIRLSPTNLSTFEFVMDYVKLSMVGSFELFLENWKHRHHMILQLLFNAYCDYELEFHYLFEKYKATGMIKKFEIAIK
jgi:hypothetical protein